jgi:DNA-binding LytR/AlgR family response regulator
MQKVKILIIEDELIIAEGLKIMLEGMGYEITGIFTSGAETLKNFKQGLADILFMDIHLAGNSSGIDTAMELRKTSAIPVIYLTKNQDEYLRKKAIYETNAAHYLTKPFSKADISIAIDFALKMLKTHEFAGMKPNENAYLVNDSIFLKNGLGYKKIMIADIMYLKADGSYCEFNFKEGKEKTQVFSENLSYFEEKLAFARELVRIHRSYIVNINFIERVHENRAWVKGLEIPIGRTYKSELVEKFRFI